MACVNERPNCGTAEAGVVPEALTEVIKWIVIIWGGIGTILGVLKALGAISVSGGVISIGGTAIATGFFAGAAVGFVVAVTTFVVVLNSARDRCNPSDATSECVAGVVVAMEASFSSTLDEFAPWQAMHDRVDLIVKSFFWPVVESGEAFVFCTDEPWPRRSEIMRIYFFDRQVCDAAQGATVGAAVGMVAGIIAAAAIAAVMCITVVLCIIGLLLAAAVAAAAVLGGAAIGGQIGKAGSQEQDPTADGQTLGVGHLVTARGPMERREYDDGANVIYWAESAQFHGVSMSPQPFSYCEINDEFEDGCQRVIIE
jgi:hypothetical protein